MRIRLLVFRVGTDRRISSRAVSTPATPATFAEALQQFYAQQFTGAVTIHFAQGHPNAIEIPQEPTRIRLTKAPKRAQD